mmetsp:Transcript_26098/g.82832  ORF Transcript_26098/g.82832 Transcript_26098/m.82832 type:complete len:652 (-) Transcript_26098:321-2276(-)
MSEYFCVFKRSSVNELERRVVIESHGEVFSGLVRFDDEDITVGDVEGALRRLSSKKKTMPLWCTKEELPKDAPFHSIAMTLDDTCVFVRDEIAEAQDILEDMSQYGMTAWIDSAEGKSYFELRTCKDHLADVELACLKTFLGTLKVHIIFLNRSYYITMCDVSSCETSLEDNTFPDISSKGAGFQIKLFDSGSEFTHLAIWQLLDKDELCMRDVMRERARGLAGEGKEEKSAAVARDEDDMSFAGEDDMTHINSDYLWGNCKEAYAGSYTQTYLMLRSEDGTTARRALFRYGNWVYGGSIDMDQQVTLHDVPLVLRKFQRQQGRLAYWMEIAKLPDGLPFSAPMKHFAMSCAFLEREMLKAENTLTEITEYHKKKGIPAWVDEENGCQFFELETAGDQEHFKDVELMASKTYFKGVVVITIFFEGSFYVTLSPSVDDQPLLDMSFPDVESKGRALQLATYKHPEYKKLMLWQSTRSVWETANRAVLEQRRLAALKRQAEEALNADTDRAGRQQQRQKEQQQDEAHHRSTARSAKPSVDEDAPVESKSSDCRETKSDIAPAKARPVGGLSPGADFAVERKGSALSRGTLEQKLNSPGARAPHHLKPLDGLGGSGSRLPALDPDLIDIDAPWDSLGRPKALFAGAGDSSSSKK